jgi:hypothetical protein
MVLLACFASLRHGELTGLRRKHRCSLVRRAAGRGGRTSIESGIRLVRKPACRSFISRPAAHQEHLRRRDRRQPQGPDGAHGSRCPAGPRWSTSTPRKLRGWSLPRARTSSSRSWSRAAGPLRARRSNGTLMARTLEMTKAQAGDESLSWAFVVERATRIELAQPAWKAGALPLSYARAWSPNDRGLAYRFARGGRRPVSPRESRASGERSEPKLTPMSRRAALPPTLAAQQSRGVAQFGSALALGARGRGFKSRHPDRVLAGQRGICLADQPARRGSALAIC